MNNFMTSQTLRLHMKGLLFAMLIMAAATQPSTTISFAAQPNGPELFIQTGHADNVMALAFGGDGMKLASAGMDRKVKLWDVGAQTELRSLLSSSNRFDTMDTSGGPIKLVDFSCSVAVSPDERWLAAGSWADRVKLWDLSTGRERQLANTARVNVVAFSVNGRWLAGGSEDGTVKVWEVSNWRLTRSLTAHSNQVKALTFSADGRSLLAAAGDGAVKSWVVGTWADEKSWPARGEARDFRAFGLPPFPIEVALSADGRTLAKLMNNTTIKSWNLETGTEGPQLIGELAHQIGAFGLSPDGRLIASAGMNGVVKLWQVASGQPLPPLQVNNFPFSVSFSPDGRLLAVGTRRGIRVYETNSWREEKKPLEGRTVAQMDVDFSPDGRFLATGGFDGRVRVWDTGAGVQLPALGDDTTGSMADVTFGAPLSQGGMPTNLAFPINDVRFSADGRRLTATAVSGRVKSWEVGTWKGLPAQTPPEGHDAVTHSEDGLWRASRLGIEPDKVFLTNLITREVRPLNDEPPPGATANNPEARRVITIAFSPDGRSLVVGREDGSMQLWDTAGATLRQSTQLHLRAVSSLTFSKSGQLLASSDMTGMTKVWHLSATPVGSFQMKFAFDAAGVRGVFSPDETELATITFEFDIKLWRVVDGNLKRSLPGDASWAAAGLSYSHDGRWLASSGGDGGTRLWHTSAWAHALTLVTLRGTSDWLAISQNGLFDGRADAMRQVSWRIGDSNDVVSLDTFYNDFYYPGLLSDVAAERTPRYEGLDIAALLQFPSLRTMLRQRLAHVAGRDGQTVVCFRDDPTTISVNLIHNGEKVSVNGFTFDPKDSSCRFRKAVQQEGTQLEVFNALNTPGPAVGNNWEGDGTDTMGATLHVLTVGVTEYTHLQRLPFSVAGAQAVEDFFVRQKANGDHPFRDIRIWPHLFDGQATLSRVRDALSVMAREVKADDVVFLFFSGHGVIPPGHEMFYFMPSGGRIRTFEDYQETGLSTAMLAEAVRDMPAGRVVLVIDACQSGGAVESLAKIGRVKELAAARQKGGPTSHPPEVGVHIIAAAAPLQYAKQFPTIGNGALVATLLSALKGKELTDEERAEDARIWIADLIEHIREQTPVISLRASNGSLTQTPLIESFGVDFPLAGGRP